MPKATYPRVPHAVTPSYDDGWANGNPYVQIEMGSYAKYRHLNKGFTVEQVKEFDALNKTINGSEKRTVKEIKLEEGRKRAEDELKKKNKGKKAPAKKKEESADEAVGKKMAAAQARKGTPSTKKPATKKKVAKKPAAKKPAAKKLKAKKTVIVKGYKKPKSPKKPKK